MDRIGTIVGSIVIGASLIIGANIIKESNFLDSRFTTSSVHVPNDLKLELEGKEVLVLSEAASYLGMESRELESAIKTDKFKGLPYVKLGNSYVFSKKLIDLWVEEASKSRESY